MEDYSDSIDFKVNKCVIDASNSLLVNEYGLEIFDYKDKKIISERKSEDRIEFLNFYNYSKDDTRIIYGDEKGNIFYSVI